MDMGAVEWNEFLNSAVDQEISGFEEKAHAWAAQYSIESDDYLAESCLMTFYGDNPREWLEDAFETVTMSCCISEEEAIPMLMKLYNDVMAELSVKY